MTITTCDCGELEVHFATTKPLLRLIFAATIATLCSIGLHGKVEVLFIQRLRASTRSIWRTA